jgi:hypothetical protein
MAGTERTSPKRMAKVLEFFKHFNWRGIMSKQLLSFVVLVVVVVAAVSLIAFTARAKDIAEDISLPLLAIGGVVALLAVLALVSVTFGFFGLSDPTQALALPEGSIRAVIALSLVVLFAILSVFLYRGLAMEGPERTISANQDARDGFLTNNPNARDVRIEVALGKDGKEIQPKTYTITYRNTKNPASEDFAKQLLVMLGTLMTAVASFYFGAKTAAAQQSLDAARLPPTLRGIQPPSYSLATGKPLDLEIAGENLNSIKAVKIANQTNQVTASDIVSNDNVVKCRISIASTTPQGKWDVVVTDSASKTATLPGALEIKA